MTTRRLLSWLTTVLAALVTFGSSGSAMAQSAVGNDVRAQGFLADAAAVQGATRARLGVLGDAFSCPDARFASFRRSDLEPQVVDQWYVASQVWADAALLRTAAVTAVAPANWDPLDTRCYLEKELVFLDRLWDYSTAGYFPRADPTGLNVDHGVRYTDDNLIAGLAWLEAAQTTQDPLAMRQYVHSAEREADFLMLPSAGLWDTTFGGGFWWNTGRGDSPEGKPAQTNALAGLFFSRLYAATGNVTYREWSIRSLLWLDTILYDPSRHLYRWSVAYSDIPARTGATVSQRYFNYDQSLAVEAELGAMALDGDGNRLTRAQAVARAMRTTFWSPDLGGYNLEAGVEQVYASYGAWSGLGYLSLFAVDADAEWLNLAQEDLDALRQRLAEPDGGVAYRTYRCVDRTAAGCTGVAAGTVVVDHVRDGAAQAWLQHLEVGLALGTSPPG